MRILALADLCNPTKISTSFFGYQIVRALVGKVEHFTLATQVRNKGSFTGQDIGVDELVFLDTEYIARPLYQLGLRIRGGEQKAVTLAMAMLYPSYRAFEREAWKQFGPPAPPWGV